MKLVKVVALGYVVKTALFGAAWLFIPDLPQRTASMLRDTWTWVAHHDAPRPMLPVTAAATITDARASQPLPAPAH
jgi:hypothetical protein